MRMSFPVEDEAAFRTCRDELCTDFADWQYRHGGEADPSVARLLLDWKWGYGDGELGHWSVADIDEFLLGWCPRKLPARPDECAGVPGSVAAFLDFLAGRGLLAPRPASPAALRRHCEKIAPRFLQEMSDPANFGTAKSLLGGADGLAELSRLTGSAPEELVELLGAAEDEARLIGPVRLPTAAEHLDSIRAAPAFQQVRGLAERCPAPGAALTATGELHLGDARRLVVDLGTGDDPDPPNRTLQSAAELPTLSWVVDLALGAGAVHRHDGRLVAVAPFAGLPDPDAHRELVLAALDLGPGGPAGQELQHLDQVREFLDEGVVRLLAELLDSHADGEEGISVEELVELVTAVLAVAFPGIPPAARDRAGSYVVAQLDRLVQLGVLAAPGRTGHLAAADLVALAPAGVGLAAELVTDELDIEVVVRADPATADATTMAGTLLMLDRDTAEADLAAWFAARPEPSAAAADLLDELAADGQDPELVLAGLDLAGEVLGEHAVPAARRHLEGPHDPLVVTWLLTRQAIDPATVESDRVLTGLVAVAAVLLDTDGPEGAIEFLRGSEREQALELLEHLWRLDHPRVPDVLDALGRHHPDKKVAKAARRNLMRHRSRAAS